MVKQLGENENLGYSWGFRAAVKTLQNQYITIRQLESYSLSMTGDVTIIINRQRKYSGIYFLDAVELDKNSPLFTGSSKHLRGAVTLQLIW